MLFFLVFNHTLAIESNFKTAGDKSQLNLENVRTAHTRTNAEYRQREAGCLQYRPSATVMCAV